MYECNVFKWLNDLFSIVIGNKIPAHCGVTMFVNQF